MADRVYIASSFTLCGASALIIFNIIAYMGLLDQPQPSLFAIALGLYCVYVVSTSATCIHKLAVESEDYGVLMIFSSVQLLLHLIFCVRATFIGLDVFGSFGNVIYRIIIIHGVVLIAQNLAIIVCMNRRSISEV